MRRTPLQPHSLGASPPRSVRLARFAALARWYASDSPTASLARRFAASLRSSGSLRCARSLVCVGLPYSLTRSALRRLAPFVWLASLRSLAGMRRTPLQPHSLGASPPRSVRLARFAALARWYASDTGVTDQPLTTGCRPTAGRQPLTVDWNRVTPVRFGQREPHGSG